MPITTVEMVGNQYIFDERTQKELNSLFIMFTMVGMIVIKGKSQVNTTSVVTKEKKIILRY